MATAGILDFKMPAAKKMDKIGLQLYTLRDIIGKDPKAVIASVAKIGFRELEIYGYSMGNEVITPVHKLSSWVLVSLAYSPVF